MISRHRSARDVERKRLVAYVRTQLTGKGLSFGLGEQVLYGTSPLERFFTALLFPIHESEEETDEDNGEWEQGDYDVSPGLATEMQGQPSIAMPAGRKRRYMPPSSVGISFFLTGENPVLRVFYHAVRYRQLKKRDESSGQFLASAWERIHFMDSGHEVVFEPHGLAKYSVLRDGNNDGCARIEAVWRPYQNGYLVTLTLSNQQRLEPDLQGPDYTRQRNETTLFEVELRCIIEAGVIGQYPSRNKALLSEEEKRIELRYKDVPIYAVGHGAAADWGENVEGRMEVRVDFIPELEVPQVTADTAAGNETVLQFAFLQKEDNPELIRSLQQFVDGYAVWVGEQCERAAGEAPEDREIALGMVQDQQRALERMQTGIALLEQDIKCRRAFAVMNQAMLMQWQVADNNKGSPKPAQVYQWRPFQLAFILMALESTARENSSERDTLDLIWFPTGGGKTEAYLGLMAFAFVLRRLLYPGSGAGTAAIMRYTLRLLTTQQFLRANRVMMALELIRRDAASFSSGLGDSPFSSGIWVGNATSPNHFEEARGLVERGMFSKLVLQACPWCDTPFKAENYVAGEHDFYFCCTHPECDFGRHPAPYNRLPCNVVDEALYKDPPTLLISTVDKFARFAWEARASVFLGGEHRRAPELVIQDELHLIAGALGSIVGLYEAGIAAALASKKVYPKYIASTATIRNAAQQVRTLFARDMQLFPPSGLRHDDSYFARTVPLEQKSGRLYLGYLAPLLPQQECLSPLAGALLTAPVVLFREDEAHQDCWWTQLIYHGSLKGLANSNTLYQSSIPRYQSRLTLEALKQAVDEESPGFLESRKIRKLEDYEKVTDPVLKRQVEAFLPVRETALCSLSSQNTAEENAIFFAGLAREKHEQDCVDVVLATNMISVGLDVSRLALMILNGQPLTTAEYIQASSRVGRGETPGVVFVNYYRNQARSLSHYETFRSYHESFYRFVEPSSLTPFTWQARQRALHAALVIAIRHGVAGLLKDERAGDFNKEDEKVRAVIQALEWRCRNALAGQEALADNTLAHIRNLVETWHQEVADCERNRVSLHYYGKDRGFRLLLCNFNEDRGLWKTLQSMRNVENTGLFRLVVKKMGNDEKQAC